MTKLNFKEWLEERGLLEEYVDAVAPTLCYHVNRMALEDSSEERWISGSCAGIGSSRDDFLKWCRASEDWGRALKQAGSGNVEFGMAVSDELAMRLSAKEGPRDGS